MHVKGPSRLMETGYLAKVAEVGSGAGGFALHGVATDDNGHAVAMLTGTIRDFRRPVVRIWALRAGGLFSEYWEKISIKFEEQFWIDALSDE